MRRAMQWLMVVVGILTIGGLASVGSVFAQSNGLGISPRKDFTIKPGDHVSDTLFVSNLSKTQDLHVGIRIVDFKPQDETGTPALELQDNAPQTPWSLKPFIKVANTVKIAAGKSANVPFTITVPANQGAGSYYSAVEFVAENPETQQKVNIAASTATLIFVTVPGQAKEQLTLKQFGGFASDKEGKNGAFQSMFVAHQPLQLAYRLENTGNLAEQPAGSVIIKNIFGKQVKSISDANPKKQLALIGQTRRIDLCINPVQTTVKENGQETQQTVCKDPHLMPGRYSAQLVLFYGLNGNNTRELSGSTTFWYLPAWFLVLVVIVIGLVVGLIWWICCKVNATKRRK